MIALRQDMQDIKIFYPVHHAACDHANPVPWLMRIAFSFPELISHAHVGPNADIPLVTQKLAYGLRESALKSTAAGFANAPVLIQYEDVCDRRFQGTLTQPISQFLSYERYTP